MRQLVKKIGLLVPALALAGSLALPLAGCEQEHEYKTPQGDVKVEREADGDVKVERDRDIGDLGAEAGRDLKQAGQRAGEDLREGVDDARKHVPDVDVDVKTRDAQPSGGTR